LLWGDHRQRAVLAILLLHAGEVIASDCLVDELSGEGVPATATKTIQVYISKLRRELGDGVLITRASGYVPNCDRADVDARRFQALAADGRRALETNDPQQAAQCLRDALGSWHGEPLADFVSESFAQGEVARLADARLAALEDRIDADLALGGHASLVCELETLVREHPLRERPRGQLIAGALPRGATSRGVRRVPTRTGPSRRLVGVRTWPRAHGAPEADPRASRITCVALRSGVRRTRTTDPRAKIRGVIPNAPTAMLGRRDELDKIAHLLARSMFGS